MGSGHGGLTCSVLLQRLGTKRISDESAILAKAKVQPDCKSSLWLKRRPKPAVSLIEITPRTPAVSDHEEEEQILWDWESEFTSKF